MLPSCAPSPPRNCISRNEFIAAKTCHELATVFQIFSKNLSLSTSFAGTAFKKEASTGRDTIFLTEIASLNHVLKTVNYVT